MLQKVAITTFMIFWCTVAISQVTFGVKGGVNLNRLVIGNLPEFYDLETNSSLGYHVSVFSRIELSSKFSLIPELQFIQKGYKMTEKVAGTSNEAHYKINYLEIPMVIAYSPAKLLGLEVGPTAGLHLGTKVVSDAGRYSVDDVHESFEFGLVSGLRFNFSERFSVVCRYYHGLSTIAEIFFTEDGITGEMSEMYNRNIQCSAYYTLEW